MRLHYDTETDSLYVYLAGLEAGVASTDRRLDERRLIDYDRYGQPIGIELLEVSRGVDLRGLPSANEIRAAIRALARLAEGEA